MSQNVTLTWLGHSCYRMEYKGYSLVIDPYGDGAVPGLAPLRVAADAVYCTHEHRDHGFREAVTLTGKAAPADFAVETALCPHDECGGAKRGMNAVHLFRFGALRVVHMGDVGCMPGEEVLGLIRGCDLMMIPVGGYYTVDAAEAAEIVRAAAPRCVTPCHYRDGERDYDVLGTVDEFTRRFDAVTHTGNTLTLGAEAPRGVVVMNF